MGTYTTYDNRATTRKTIGPIVLVVLGLLLFFCLLATPTIMEISAGGANFRIDLEANYNGHYIVKEQVDANGYIICDSCWVVYHVGLVSGRIVYEKYDFIYEPMMFESEQEAREYVDKRVATL